MKALNFTPMDFELLAQLLKELILDNDRVSLPGMGSFIADISPAYFSENGKTINPPFRRIFFRTNETWNDEIIEKYYADKFRLDINSVKVELEEFFEKFRLDLNVKKNIDLPGFGKMRSTKEGNIFFVAEKGLDLYANAFGLEPISLKVLTFDASSKIENKEMRGDSLLSEKDATEMHGERNIEFIIDDETAELIAQDKEEKEISRSSELAQEPELKQEHTPFEFDVADVDGDEFVQKPTKTDVAPASESSSEPESSSAPASESSSEPESSSAPASESSSEPESSSAPASESSSEPIFQYDKLLFNMEDEESEADEYERIRARKRRGWLIVLLTILSIIVILFILMLLFKEQAGDLLENILYSQEELDLINKVN